MLQGINLCWTSQKQNRRLKRNRMRSWHAVVLGSEEQPAKRWAKTLGLGFLIYTYKYTGITGQLAALQHSCKIVKWSASAWTQTRTGVQWAANTFRVTDNCTVAQGRARMEDQQAYLFHWWLCCFHLFKNIQSGFFFFSFLLPFCLDFLVYFCLN